jgi:hypothetical protein
MKAVLSKYDCFDIVNILDHICTLSLFLQIFLDTSFQILLQLASGIRIWFLKIFSGFERLSPFSNDFP